MRILLRITIAICFSFQPLAYAQVQTSAEMSGTGKLSSAPALLDEQKVNLAPPGGDGRTDHQARIFDFKGEVRVLKHDGEDWMPAKKEMILEAGDQILTGKKSFLDLVYDAQFLNIARIEPNTKAEFRSIEPTDLHLEDGTIFNALDGLAGQNYQISSPTAVAGVRGTELFASFDASTRLFTAGVLETAGVHSAVLIAQEQTVVLTEGNQMEVSAGEAPSAGLIEIIPPGTVEHFQDLKSDILQDVDPSLLATAENSLQENPILEAADEQNKNVGGNDGPGGGNDQGGGNLDNPTADGGNLLAGFSSTDDALIDAVLTAPIVDSTETIPAENGEKWAGSTDPKKKNPTDEENSDPNASESSTSTSTGTATTAPTLNGAMRFMALGSDQLGQGSSTTGGDANADAVARAARIAAQWGMPAPAAQTMGQFFATGTSGYHPPMNSGAMPPGSYAPGSNNFPAGSAPAGGYTGPATGYAPNAGGTPPQVSPEEANRAAVQLAAFIASGGSGKSIQDFYGSPTMAGMMPNLGGWGSDPSMHNSAGMYGGAANAGMYAGAPGSAAAGMYGGAVPTGTAYGTPGMPGGAPGSAAAMYGGAAGAGMYGGPAGMYGGAPGSAAAGMYGGPAAGGMYPGPMDSAANTGMMGHMAPGYDPVAASTAAMVAAQTAAYAAGYDPPYDPMLAAQAAADAAIVAAQLASQTVAQQYAQDTATYTPPPTGTCYDGQGYPIPC